MKVRLDSEILLCSATHINTWLHTDPVDQLIVIADINVWKHYRDYFDFAKEGRSVIIWQSLDGESCKDLKHYFTCVDSILAQGIHRYCHLLAIGGGATTDFAGFVASTLLRGISWTAVPTTLLAMVDAAIGGKTALNSAAGKNLIGSFHPPSRVWLCSEFLDTLTDDEIKSGMGEVLKYCLLSEEINQAVHSASQIEVIIDLCARYKASIVEHDPYEAGLRRVLNYGHTFGHAFERTFGFGHGVSVTLGIQLIIDLFHTSSQIRGEYNALAQILGLGFTTELYSSSMRQLASNTVQLDEFLCLVDRDKKKTDARSIEVVVVGEVGLPERIKLDSVVLLHSVKQLIAQFKPS